MADAQPMIVHQIEALRDAGVTEVVLAIKCAVCRGLLRRQQCCAARFWHLICPTVALLTGAALRAHSYQPQVMYSFIEEYQAKLGVKITISQARVRVARRVRGV